ncbi:putative Myosin-2 essential light chain [Hypsibius exemplaris]|uniref:Myosin-2 essential light chain n=1 Tax=Hypsibius exemplaris TaxID=2072580 RepID=A0A1W0X7P8_HYPEX|nr:putative Myosin-2 essential light chain [Hypsibius exemplaris]
MELQQWELQEAFSLFDTRGDGKIFARQIGEVLRALGQNPTEDQVRKFGFANKPDDRINFETFVPILNEVSKIKSTYRSEDFLEGFRHFDKDQQGTIHSSQMRHLLTTLGDRLSDEEFEQLVADFIRNITSNL